MTVARQTGSKAWIQALAIYFNFRPYFRFPCVQQDNSSLLKAQSTIFAYIIFDEMYITDRLAIVAESKDCVTIELNWIYLDWIYLILHSTKVQ